MKILCTTLGICVCAFSVPSTQATTLIVTTTAGSGAGSLRDTIAAASGGDTIQFAAALNGQAITLTSAEIVINKSLAITGPGASQLRDSNGALLIANDNWRDDPVQELAILTTGIPPNNDLESAIFANLVPGEYTALAAGRTNGTGIGYVQLYSLPHSGPVLPLIP